LIGFIRIDERISYEKYGKRQDSGRSQEEQSVDSLFSHEYFIKIVK
jgi:hypothetical protein